MMRYKIWILTLIVFFKCSCLRTNPPVIRKEDFPKVLEATLNYILKTERLVPEYYNQPLQIIGNSKFPSTENITVNGTTCKLLPADTNVNDILNGMDIYNPVPIVQTSNFQYEGNKAQLTVTLRATGHSFLIAAMKLKNQRYTVSKLSNYTL